jgi:hypothetical protein
MAVIVGIGLEDEHLNDRGRINRTAVRGGFFKASISVPSSHQLRGLRE